MGIAGKLFEGGVIGYLASKAVQGYIFGTQLKELSTTLNPRQVDYVRTYAEKHDILPKEAFDRLLHKYGFVPV